ncbi:MAG: dTDP-4-dehydrorhamnose reductase [Paracoccaceae bacterium]
MRLLVIGRSGQLARALDAAAGGGVRMRCLGRDAVDLTIHGQAGGAIAVERPDLVINAAAYTAVDDAETERETAFRVNGAAVGEIARAASAAGAALIHISTDYVFDGRKTGAYVEADPVSPSNAYGASKRAGELAALRGCARTVVLRTSWVYSPWGRNFVLTMLKLAREHTRLRIVDDQYGKPTSALDLADACLAIGPRLVAAPAESPLWGLYHYAGGGACCWADFAAGIFDQAGRRHGGRIPGIERIGTADYPTKVPRPANSALDCSKFETIFGITTVPWPAALARVLGMIEDRARVRRLSPDGEPAPCLPGQAGRSAPEAPDRRRSGRSTAR